MKAGELFHLLASTNCGDEVTVLFGGKRIDISTLFDNSDGDFILEAGNYVDDDESEEE